MSNCAIVGINWGDEGKGRMVDLLTQDYDLVVRYRGAATPDTPSSTSMENLPSIFFPRVFSARGLSMSWGTGWLWTRRTCGQR